MRQSKDDPSTSQRSEKADETKQHRVNDQTEEAARLSCHLGMSLRVGQLIKMADLRVWRARKYLVNDLILPFAFDETINCRIALAIICHTLPMPNHTCVHSSFQRANAPPIISHDKREHNSSKGKRNP